VDGECHVLRRVFIRCVTSLCLAQLPEHLAAALVFGVAVYLSVTIPALRTVIMPAKEDVYEDQVQALQLVSAGNVINLVLIALILLLQVRACRFLCVPSPADVDTPGRPRIRAKDRNEGASTARGGSEGGFRGKEGPIESISPMPGLCPLNLCPQCAYLALCITRVYCKPKRVSDVGWQPLALASTCLPSARRRRRRRRHRSLRLCHTSASGPETTAADALWIRPSPRPRLDRARVVGLAPPVWTV
jgi:hypothetical protein